MHVVRDVASLRAAVASTRARGERIGFVPTMGALHAGHLSLIERARAQCVSVVPERMADRWEGAISPGHFAGVLTVVARLFNLVQPDVAVFGQKDLQQATLILALVPDLDVPVTLDIAPIFREQDGLALSSRNRFLDGDARRAARVLSQCLVTIAGRFAAGCSDVRALIADGDARLRTESSVQTDYLSVVDPIGLEPVSSASVGDFVIVAARIGATRLLDNHRLGDPLPRLS